MKKGFAFIFIIIGIVILGVLGGAGYIVAKNFTNTEKPRNFEFLGNNNSSSSKKPSPSPKTVTLPSPASQALDVTSVPSAVPATTPSPSAPIIYTQPQGKYTITLPSGWQYDSTAATTTYSTTKFTGPNGNISMTFGSGKDPLGGCSEATQVILADRTISGCFLLQKDGSQILTRAYTKDSAGINFTIEAYINPELSVNGPIVLSIIKTIHIN